MAHLDMDAFYASVELRRRPELKGKPVIVCGSGPRAVVTTASYEARRLAGIHSAMPAAVARRRLPDAVYMQPDFAAYRDASRQVMAILRRNVETVEVVGMDEAYLDLTGLFSPKATMRRIGSRDPGGDRARPARSGSRRAGMLAKITSELGKPGGLVVLSREEALERFADRAPGLMPGIGPKTARSWSGWDPDTGRTARAGVEALQEASGRDRAVAEPARGLRRRDPAHGARETKSQSRRRPSTSTSPTSARWSARSRAWPRSSAAACASATWRPHGRDQGAARRLDQRTRSHTVEEPTNDPAVVAPVASTCCAPTTRRARCGCSASASPPSRAATRRPRRRRSATSPSSASRLRVHCRFAGARAVCED